MKERRFDARIATCLAGFIAAILLSVVLGTEIHSNPILCAAYRVAEEGTVNISAVRCIG
ncbi:MAG: hypothetical protein V1932_09285 [Chloroflexota bacterium]